MDGTQNMLQEKFRETKTKQKLTRHLSADDGHVTAWLSSNLEQPLQLTHRKADVAIGNTITKTTNIHNRPSMSFNYCYYPPFFFNSSLLNSHSHTQVVYVLLYSTHLRKRCWICF